MAGEHIHTHTYVQKDRNYARNCEGENIVKCSLNKL